MSILDALTEYASSPDVTVVNLITAWQPTPIFLPGESMDRRAWRATAQRVTQSQARLGD